MLRDARCRAAARAACDAALAVTVAAGLLTGCAETPLNEAPIVDRSSRPPAASVATVSGSRQDAGKMPGQEAAPTFYTVQKGDTLFHVGVLFHCSVQDLARWNGIEENAPLTVGQRLRVRAPVAIVANSQSPVPPAANATSAEASEVTPAEVHAVAAPQGPAVETHVLEAAPLAAPPASQTAAPSPASGVPPQGSAGAAVTSTAAAPAVSAPSPSGGEQAAGSTFVSVAPETEKPAASVAWLWPVEGRITGAFDPVHTKGIEITPRDGAKVVAVADGEVSYTGAPRDYGNLVIVRHPDGLLSVYAHAKSILVAQGQSVKRGQTIAIAGGTDGTQSLHFEVRRKGVPVNPLELLPAR